MTKAADLSNFPNRMPAGDGATARADLGLTIPTEVFSNRTSEEKTNDTSAYVSTDVTYTVPAGGDGTYLLLPVHRVTSINQRLAVFRDFGGAGSENLLVSMTAPNDGLLASGANAMMGVVQLSEGDVLTLVFARRADSGTATLGALSGFDLVRLASA